MSNRLLMEFEFGGVGISPEEQQELREVTRSGVVEIVGEVEAVSSYTNSPLVVYTRISPNQSGTRTHAIDRITPHCVVGQCTAEALGALFAEPSRQASSNYGVDKDGRVGMYVPESNRAWTSCSVENDQRAVTIEVASDTTKPWAFREVAYNRLVELCVDICQRNGKTKLLWLGDKDNSLAYKPAPNEMVLTAHRFFYNTQCPGDWMYSRMGQLAEQVTAALHVNDNTPAKWAAEAVEWAVDNKIMVGSGDDLMLRQPVTREQFCVMLKRFYDLFCVAG